MQSAQAWSRNCKFDAWPHCRSLIWRSSEEKVQKVPTVPVAMQLYLDLFCAVLSGIELLQELNIERAVTSSASSRVNMLMTKTNVQLQVLGLNWPNSGPCWTLLVLSTAPAEITHDEEWWRRRQSDSLQGAGQPRIHGFCFKLQIVWAYVLWRTHSS